MFLIRLLLFPFRLLFGTTKVATKTSYRAGRLVGYRRIFVFGAGVAVGMLVAPVAGRDLRRRLLEGTGIATGDAVVPLPPDGLADEVRSHLRQAPRTWHLPQPVVTEVSAGKVRIDGVVADDTARRDLEVTVSQVDGVVHVDNQIRLSGSITAE